MARISIDDELHADVRFKRLVRKLSNEDQAIGLLYRFWRMAQDYWADECSLMPIAEFESEDFRPLAEVGFAEQRGEGYYAAGAEERFGWYLQKCRASKAGVKARSVNRNNTPVNRNASPVNPSDEPEHASRSTVEAPPVNPSLLTSTVISTSTSTSTDNATAPVSAVGVGELQGQIKEASEAWIECLKKWGAERELFPWEQVEFARNIQARGIEAVKLAILGQRYEPETETYKPSRHLSLKRLFDPQKFDRFVNLGAQARKKLQEREQIQAQIAQTRSLPPEQEPTDNPEAIKAYLDGFLGKMPKESA